MVNGWQARSINSRILHPRDRSIRSAESLYSGRMPEFTITALSAALTDLLKMLADTNEFL